MRKAYNWTAIILLLVLSLLPTINASNTQTYTSNDLHCWNGFSGNPSLMSNPQAFEQITIPKYAKSITLSVSKGAGDGGTFNLRNCAYNSCTTPQYYMTTCPSINIYGFGNTDLTNTLIPEATYDLRLDGEGLGQNRQSVQVLTSVLTIEKFFLYNLSDSFDYQSDKTVRSTIVNVYSGEGNCSAQVAQSVDYNINNARVVNQTGIITSAYNASKSSLDFNCTEGNYSINLDLPAVLKNVDYNQDENTQSDLTTQNLKVNAWVKNPAVNTTYPNVTLNFTLPISVINTSGDLKNKFDLNASENKTFTVNAYTTQGVNVTPMQSKVESVNSTNYKLSKVFEITNNLPFSLKNVNSTSVINLPNTQSLIIKNWTCQIDKQIINITSTESVTLTCFKEKIATHVISQINVINASIDEVNAQITLMISNSEDESFNLDLNSLLTQNYSRQVNADSNVSLNALESKTINVNITGKFLNTEQINENVGNRTVKTLRVWNETGFNVVNAIGALNAESNWEDVRLEVYNNDHYSDITPNSNYTCDNFTVFNLESGVWKTCKNQTAYKFVIPHFSTAVLKLSGQETQPTPQPQNIPTTSSNDNSGSGGGGGGGSGVTTIKRLNSTSVEKLNISNDFTFKISESDLEITLPVNGISEGEFTSITVKVKNVPLDEEMVKFTRPDGSVKTQTAKKGAVDFFADKSGQWTVEYKGVKKTFMINSALGLKENQVNTQKTPASNLTGFVIAMPKLPVIPIIILIAIIAVGFFAFKNYNKNTAFKRVVNGNKVSISITNNTKQPMKNLVLTEILSESSKITSESQKHDEYKEMVYGDEYKWRKDALLSGQTWVLNYETTKTSINSKCELTYIGINNITSVIKPK